MTKRFLRVIYLSFNENRQNICIQKISARDPSLDERICIVIHQKEDKKKLMNAARERARAQLWSTFPLLQALSFILTLFYLPTFEGFRILLLSFALLLQFLFCVVLLNKKMKVWTISLSFPILKVLQLLLKSRSSIVWHFWKRNIALNQSEMKR